MKVKLAALATLMLIDTVASAATTTRRRPTNQDTKHQAVEAPARPGEFVFNEKQGIRVEGEIGRNVLGAADGINQIVEKSTAPGTIDIFINSPGGSIFAGGLVVAAMTQAQSQGFKFRCAVGTMAASMAFVILSYCDERVALFNSLLMWHPGRTGSNQPVTAEELEAMARSLRLFEDTYEGQMQRALGISPEAYALSRRQEMTWPAIKLVEFAPGFISIVQSIRINSQLNAFTKRGNGPVIDEE